MRTVSTGSDLKTISPAKLVATTTSVSLTANVAESDWENNGVGETEFSEDESQAARAVRLRITSSAPARRGLTQDWRIGIRRRRGDSKQDEDLSRFMVGLFCKPQSGGYSYFKTM